MINVLFVCSRNQWRSPTAQKVWRNVNGLKVRSAGTSPQARRVITASDLQWADIVFAMEKKHHNQLRAKFPRIVQNQKVYVLDIPDEYQYMDPELIELLEESVAPYLGIE